jgi:ribosome-associated protein
MPGFYRPHRERTNHYEAVILLHVPCRPETMTDTKTGEISKSQQKRDLEALKQLGWRLLEFSDDALRQMPLPETLLEALRTARRITSHGARRRQMQFIGKLMRGIDTAPVREAIDAADHQRSSQTREFHLIEELRDRLLAEGDAALPGVLSHFPQCDRQHLRKLVRQAQKEQAHDQPPRATRQLFRYLRELQENPGG